MSKKKKWLIYNVDGVFKNMSSWDCGSSNMFYSLKNGEFKLLVLENNLPWILSGHHTEHFRILVHCVPPWISILNADKLVFLFYARGQEF